MASVTTPNGFQLDDSGQRVVVDPICRIEGHLRIEVNLDENNVIRNAVSTGNMWRGLEVIPVSYTHLTLPTRSCQCRSRGGRAQL